MSRVDELVLSRENSSWLASGANQQIVGNVRSISDRYPNTGCYLQVEPNRLLVFTSVMTGDFRPVPPANGAGDLAFTGRVEIEPTADYGTRYRAIAIHASEDACKQHADMGFAEGWGAALDQLVTLMS